MKVAKMLARCKICVMPSTRPDHEFVDGVCPACINHANKPQVDWEAREKELLNLLDRHDGRCIVPSSGGKDSTYQVIKLKELGADPLVVTAATCQLTTVGRQNIDNLARIATTIEVSPNKTVRAKLNRLGLGLVGDISWPEHAGIFATPFRISAETNIPLIFYGENPQNQYGGPQGTEEAKIMTRRWTQEFGGFLGLRPDDFVGVEGITYKDMGDYAPIEQSWMDRVGVEAHFLGQYIQWDSKRNAEVAIDNGMVQFTDSVNRPIPPTKGNWWTAENLDNAQTGIHDYFGHLKYGYSRGTAQISVDIREGLIPREEAMEWINTHERLIPFYYGGVSYENVLDRIDMSVADFWALADQFTNKDIHK